MQSEAEAVFMRKRIDEIPDKCGADTANFTVFATDGVDGPGARAEQPSDFVRIEAGSIDDAASFDGFSFGVLFIADAKRDANGIFVWLERGDFCVSEEIGAVLFGLAGEGVDECCGGASTGRGDI